MSDVFIQRTNPIQQLKEFESKVGTTQGEPDPKKFSSLLN